MRQLGAFGFLSSDEVFRNGIVNAGLLDQHYALQWIQVYIGLFGGNASHVTIAGESAGGGSVMLQNMAYGGSIGDSLFTNVSPAKTAVHRARSFAKAARLSLRRRICRCSMAIKTGSPPSRTMPLQQQ